MFSIPHLVIIFVVALIVFGPEKLPDLARNLGKVMGEFRRATGDLRSTFEGHMRDLEREAELRKIREGQSIAQTAEQTSPQSAGEMAESSTGGGNSVASRPLSTEATSDTGDFASGMQDATPPLGTVESKRPNAAALVETAAPEQLQFDTQQILTGERPDSDIEKASDVRSRPA